MPQYCWIVGLAVSVASPVCARLAAEELSHRPNSERPNIVVVLADDLGWTDVGCYGSDFYQTPHLDRLARQGVRFTAAYSACTVCSPTRAALLTGKYPARLHITDWIAGHERPDAPLQIPAWQKHLPLEEVTLAELLHERGYTTIHLGKWHLGGPEFYPRRQGFDVAVGVGGGSPGSYFYPYRRRPDDPHAVDLAEGKKGDYLTDRLTDEAIRLLAEHRDKPLFVYLSHFAVHTPLQGKPELVEKYDKLTKPDRRHRDARYAAMVESLDQSVGRLMAELDRLELTDNTLVVFASDNGGLAPPTDNQPLRSGKGDVYEGGVRVPMIVRWPGVTPSGVECRQPVVTMDLFNTLAAAAGIATDDLPQPQDGKDLSPLLGDPQAPWKPRPLFWHYPHYHTRGAAPYSAIRDGDWRLIEFFEDGRLELYNLKNDPGEQHNLADEQPQRAAELHGKLQSWRESVNAQYPTPKHGSGKKQEEKEHAK